MKYVIQSDTPMYQSINIDAVVTTAIILVIAMVTIIAMIVYCWIRIKYGLYTSDTTENQSMLIF